MGSKSSSLNKVQTFSRTGTLTISGLSCTDQNKSALRCSSPYDYSKYGYNFFCNGSYVSPFYCPQSGYGFDKSMNCVSLFNSAQTIARKIGCPVDIAPVITSATIVSTYTSTQVTSSRNPFSRETGKNFRGARSSTSISSYANPGSAVAIPGNLGYYLDSPIIVSDQTFSQTYTLQQNTVFINCVFDTDIIFEVGDWGLAIDNCNFAGDITFNNCYKTNIWFFGDNNHINKLDTKFVVSMRDNTSKEGLTQVTFNARVGSVSDAYMDFELRGDQNSRVTMYFYEFLLTDSPPDLDRPITIFKNPDISDYLIVPPPTNLKYRIEEIP